MLWVIGYEIFVSICKRYRRTYISDCLAYCCGIQLSNNHSGCQCEPNIRTRESQSNCSQLGISLTIHLENQLYQQISTQKGLLNQYQSPRVAQFQGNKTGVGWSGTEANIDGIQSHSKCDEFHRDSSVHQRRVRQDRRVSVHHCYLHRVKLHVQFNKYLHQHLRNGRLKVLAGKSSKAICTEKRRRGPPIALIEMVFTVDLRSGSKLGSIWGSRIPQADSAGIFCKINHNSFSSALPSRESFIRVAFNKNGN